jgi:hypothetical protein
VRKGKGNTVDTSRGVIEGQAIELEMEPAVPGGDLSHGAAPFAFTFDRLVEDEEGDAGQSGRIRMKHRRSRLNAKDWN